MFTYPQNPSAWPEPRNGCEIIARFPAGYQVPILTEGLAHAFHQEYATKGRPLTESESMELMTKFKISLN